MIITEVSAAGNKKDRISVVFEDGSEIKTGTAEIADFGLYPGRELTDNEYTQLLSDLALRSSKARAIRILGNRSLSAHEIEKRLKSKGESEEAAAKTVEWLEDVGIVNDEEYAASIVKHYLQRGYGRARIRDELFRRGIKRDMWDAPLAVLEDEDMYEKAYDYLAKKLSGSRDPQDVRRTVEALCRRGFSFEEARTAVKRYMESSGEAEDKEL